MLSQACNLPVSFPNLLMPSHSSVPCLPFYTGETTLLKPLLCQQRVLLTKCCTLSLIVTAKSGQGMTHLALQSSVQLCKALPALGAIKAVAEYASCKFLEALQVWLLLYCLH